MANQQPFNAFTLLTTKPPEISEARAARMLREQYALEGKLTPQDSERDQNFLLQKGSGEKYVLKIANSAEIESITDFQVAALLHLESSQVATRVPKVVRTVDGRIRIRVAAENGHTHTARVLSWLPGVMRRPNEFNPVALHRMGETLASLGQALRDFEHPANDYPLFWAIKQARLLRDPLDAVSDDGEIAVLPYLVTIRNVTAVVISHWRASMYPDNRAYILRSADRALHTLNTFGRLPPSEVTREMRDYCDRNQ